VGRATAANVAVEVVARDLEVPWALDFAPDGRIFLTERGGRIRVVAEGLLQEEPWAELPVSATGEEGLMGIALAPDFAQSGHVFVYGTFELERSEGFLARSWRRFSRYVWKTHESPYRNRVIRLTDRDGRGAAPRIVIDDVPAHQFHAGGALEFGPDGMLYVTAGEALDPPMAQDTRSLAGKLLRFRPDGTVPADNPISESPVYALGFRNPQGLAWHPESGDLMATEHGSRYDELNRVLPGANYGWPHVEGDEDPGTTSPFLTWEGSRAPSGLAIYAGTSLPWKGDALVGGLASRRLMRLALEAASGSLKLICVEDLFRDQLGRIRAVAEGPDGHVYLMTSNRDGRGQPAAGDDRLLRVSFSP
jgi:glucose/arabinose dehydrogenase